MKVDLENLRLGVSALGEKIYVGLPEKDDKSFRVKKELTSDFIKCIIDWCGGHRRIVRGNGFEYEVTVRVIKFTEFLYDKLADGWEVLPFGEPCEGFDKKTGCPGHPVDH